MGKIVVSEFISLDGVIEAPETWHFPTFSEDMGADTIAALMNTEVSLLGRVTYDIFASSWPYRTDDPTGIADKLNNMPKYVVSTTLEKADWNNTSVIRGNVEQEVAKLKEQYNGEISITGSATLIQSLTGLIDEFRLMVHPIVLGQGKRLFENGIDTTKLKLVENKVYQSGAVLLVYEANT